MWDDRAQHETVWNFNWPGCGERTDITCHMLRRIQLYSDALGRRGKMTALSMSINMVTENILI